MEQCILNSFKLNEACLLIEPCEFLTCCLPLCIVIAFFMAAIVSCFMQNPKDIGVIFLN